MMIVSVICANLSYVVSEDEFTVKINYLEIFVGSALNNIISLFSDV